METTLVVPQGSFELRRFPRFASDLLRAWDAADDYLLHHLSELQGSPGRDKGVTWILNDGFGALTVALAASGRSVQMSCDSWLAQQATRANLQENGLQDSAVHLLTSLESPAAAADVVLIKIPKSLALLEDQLHRIRTQSPGALVFGAGMTKQIHTSTLQLFESILGSTTTSLARRKARLLFSEFDEALKPDPNPYPSQYQLDGTDWTLTNHAGLFSREGLDVGTRQLLAHIPVADTAQQIVDLGCGNGVIGLMAAQRNPGAQLQFVDESFTAIASAQHNWQQIFSASRSAKFEAGDCVATLAADSVDLVLCNPPFHQHSAMGDATAWRMFSGARRVLRPGGELLVVGNRHLAYHAKLKRLFGNCEVLDSDRKFVVLRSRQGTYCSTTAVAR